MSKAAVTYGKATRQLIFEASIAPIASNYNRHIRHSLGFREKREPGRGKPVFVSENVEHLYRELDRMAREMLPNHSHEALKQAWQRGAYTDAVEQLLYELGERIWGEPIKKRKLSSNPRSQLLTTGDPGASGDLFYQHERHRAFIALQLEHLMFLKAKAFYHNHYASPATWGATKTKAVTTPSSRTNAPVAHKSNSVQVTSGMKCMVVFYLPCDKLRAILYRTSSHGSKKRRARDASGRFLPDDVVSESDEEWTPTKSRRTSRWGRKHNTGYVVESDESSTNERSSEEDGSSAEGAYDNNEATAEQVVSEESNKIMRAHLTVLLYRELCLDDEESHSKLPDTKSMLKQSEHLDSIIRTLWERGGDTIRLALRDWYEPADRTLHAWLSWREGCWLLCEATGIHPVGGKPTPRFTMVQWEQKLGGGDKCRKFHQTLVNHRRTLLASRIHDGNGETASSTAKCLARVFAAMTESPVLEYTLPDHIVAYNKLLFSWEMDLWM